jgi:hypothetical protein
MDNATSEPGLPTPPLSPLPLTEAVSRARDADTDLAATSSSLLDHSSTDQPCADVASLDYAARRSLLYQRARTQYIARHGAPGTTSADNEE